MPDNPVPDELKPGSDWFPISQLQQSFQELLAVLQSKLGIDLESMILELQTSKFPVWRFTVPSFVPGVSSNFTITVDVEQIALDYSSLVITIRTIFIAWIFFVILRTVLVVLRQY